MLGRYINFFYTSMFDWPYVLQCRTYKLTCCQHGCNHLNISFAYVLPKFYHVLFCMSIYIYMSYNLSANFAFWSLSYTCTFKTNLSLIIKRRFLYIFQHNLDLKSSSTSGRNSTWRMEKTRTVAMTT